MQFYIGPAGETA